LQLARSGEAAIGLYALIVILRRRHAGVTPAIEPRTERRTIMRKITGIALALSIGLGVVSAPSAKAEDASAQAAYRDIEQTLGSVPGFFKAFPEAGIAGAWNEFKTIQLDPKTALSNKVKELIGLAVAAQIPCQYCIYFHTAVAKANGATDEEISEAVAMASITRHWSTVLNGMQVDLATFKHETDTVLRAAGEKAKTVGMAK
jgi:AhpD family alkylhydroperoxidase